MRVGARGRWHWRILGLFIFIALTKTPDMSLSRERLILVHGFMKDAEITNSNEAVDKSPRPPQCCEDSGVAPMLRSSWVGIQKWNIEGEVIAQCRSISLACSKSWVWLRWMNEQANEWMKSEISRYRSHSTTQPKFKMTKGLRAYTTSCPCVHRVTWGRKSFHAANC